jgi:ribosomal protein S18 acetylase RimI-like enzyme
MAVQFRRATSDSLDTLLDLIHDYYTFNGIPFDALKQRSALSGLLGNPQHGYVWLIEHDKKVVGYMAVCFGYSLEFGGRDAFVDEIYLLPEARGQGIGTQAMQIMIDTCRTNGIQAVHLEVSPDNEAAIAYYEKSGFERRDFAIMSRVIGS